MPCWQHCSHLLLRSLVQYTQPDLIEGLGTRFLNCCRLSSEFVILTLGFIAHALYALSSLKFVFNPCMHALQHPFQVVTSFGFHLWMPSIYMHYTALVNKIRCKLHVYIAINWLTSGLAQCWVRSVYISITVVWRVCLMRSLLWCILCWVRALYISALFHRGTLRIGWSATTCAKCSHKFSLLWKHLNTIIPPVGNIQIFRCFNNPFTEITSISVVVRVCWKSHLHWCTVLDKWASS